jgi:Na+-transporting methylmalonyl-CoA/oxaloacetate decarboxylase gamma subunit
MKGQMKMVESVFVVIIFMIILVIAIVFFSRFQRSESQFLATEKTLKESIQLAQTFASLPEVACTESGVVRENCIDLLKLQGMNDVSRTELSYYYDLFKYGTVTVVKIYPDTDDDAGQRWTIYNKTKPGTGYFSTAIPMTLYDPTLDQRYFGLMEVRFYDG